MLADGVGNMTVAVTRTVCIRSSYIQLWVETHSSFTNYARILLLLENWLVVVHVLKI